MDILITLMIANSVLLLLTLILLVGLSRKENTRLNPEKTIKDIQKIKEQIF